MISCLMTNSNHQASNHIKQFLPETSIDLSLNLPKALERQLSSDGSVGLSLSFRSSVDSIFTLDQEEYLATSFDSTIRDNNDENKENIIEISHKRKREQNYDETYTKSPTPTKYYELLKANQKIVDEFK